eukprot:TRINITY_DN18046_c0_g1_i1.p1 TRINITY_DN18046_c0_g1~~TRINITY_DN18046_c0_g1_i1.p1  ORF type:complete len:213 (-),score=24.34 TRINITY_DN18046_c0_g1_i1:3-641(-)
MKSPERRRERTNHFLKIFLKEKYGEPIDLTAFEKENKFLEATGSLVLDRIHKIAYVAISARSHADVVDKWASLVGYRTVTFETEDNVYHTNVMMSIGTKYALLCSDAIKEERDRIRVSDQLRCESQKTVIEISLEQMAHFCGNVLELKSPSSSKLYLALSSRAYNNFTSQQIQTLTDCGITKFIHSDISGLEDASGGGVRCLLAELLSRTLR